MEYLYYAVASDESGLITYRACVGHSWEMCSETYSSTEDPGRALCGTARGMRKHTSGYHTQTCEHASLLFYLL